MAADKWIARPLSNGAFEPLEAHLESVARRAAAFADRFDARDLAEIAGLLHDLGKAKAEWQAYVRGAGPNPGHSSEGARFVEDHFDSPHRRAIAFAIAGHHAGLANGATSGGGRTPLTDRLADAERLDPVVPTHLAPATAALDARLARSRNRPFAEAFFTRMLFSALLDADRLESEAVQAADKGHAVDRGWSGELDDLKRALAEHLAAFPAPATKVDHMRASVLTACRRAAAETPGLFSLSAPTGSGKTLSSLAFALDHALAHGMERVIYVIPFTSIVEQTADVFREALGDVDAVLEHHSDFDEENVEKQAQNPDAADRLRLAAENWDRPIVVTTAVQFFESLFAANTGRCRKLHRIARSVIVLDEAQTLPLHVLRPCLAALDELARVYDSSIVLCTATQPALTAAQGLRAPEALEDVREIIPDPPALASGLNRATAVLAPEPMDDKSLAAAMAETPSALSIVNSRAHARALFAELKERSPEGARHLSTSMTAAHRRSVLDEIRAELSAEPPVPVRVVSTSLIEAGVDISFAAVWRAMAGLDSIAQAAGRCNRKGELGEGKGRVTVFEAQDWPSPKALKHLAEIGRAALDEFPDPLSPEAIQEYFRLVMTSRGVPDLDSAKVFFGGGKTTGILAAIHNGCANPKQGTLAKTNFASIAEAFRLIDDVQAPVLIDHEASAAFGAPAALIDELRHAEGVAADTLRTLQRYIVQIPRQDRTRLFREGALEDLRPTTAPGRFLRLTHADLYAPATGLDWQGSADIDPCALVI